MVEATPILASTPSLVIAVIAHQRAIKAVKQQIQAKGLKYWSFPRRDIVAQADEYLVEHRRQLFSEAVEMVRKSAELRRFYDREQRERRRWLERNSTHTHNR
jgi:hypothetical protein